MLVTTRDSGLAIIADGKIDFINTVDGLQSNTCTSLYYDSLSGKIFLGMDKGLSVISFDKNNFPQIKNYNPTNGLLCGSIFSVSEDNGEILLSTDRGLLVFNENDLNTTIETPKVYITSLQINSNNVELKPNYDLTYDANNIRIIYNGISFRNAKSLQYRYQLTPIDKGWNTTFSNTVVYPDLPPGSYKFSVQVRTGNGKWFYDNSSFNFKINKPFWTTWLFRIFGILFITAIVYSIYRYQLSKKLEQHRAISADRKRISTEMHDDLGSGLTKISLMSQVAGKTSGEKQLSILKKITNESSDMVDKMNGIIWAMNTRNDSLSNLFSFLSNSAFEMFEDSKIKLIWNAPPSFIPETPVYGETRRNIYLVVKEALHNVLKYSEATEVSIKLNVKDDELSISIEDNGKGFDSTSPIRKGNGGNGLLNMKKRMEDIHGTFNISSELNVGTKVSINCFLKNYTKV